MWRQGKQQWMAWWMSVESCGWLQYCTVKNKICEQKKKKKIHRFVKLTHAWLLTKSCHACLKKIDFHPHVTHSLLTGVDKRLMVFDSTKKQTVLNKMTTWSPLIKLAMQKSLRPGECNSMFNQQGRKAVGLVFVCLLLRQHYYKAPWKKGELVAPSFTKVAGVTQT